MIRVLVVEDEIPILRSTCTMIERVNPEFKVLYRAANGEEALHILKNNHVELVVLDIQMPILNGIELLRIMKEEGITVTTIVLSGYQDFSYVREALTMGAVDYILKPLNLEELKKILAKTEEEIWNKKSVENTNTLVGTEEDAKYEISLLVLGTLQNTYVESLMKKVQTTKWIQHIENYLLKYFAKDDYWMIPGKYENEALLVSKKLGDRTQHILQELHSYIQLKKPFELPLTILLSPELQSHDSIYTGNQKLHIWAKEVLLFHKSLYMIPDILNIKEENKRYRETMAKKLVDLNNPKQIIPALRSLIKEDERRAIILFIIKQAFWKGFSTQSGEYSYVELEDEIAVILSTSYSEEHLLESLDRLIVNNMEFEGIRNKENLADQIKVYIEEHYKENLTNTTLAERFGYVAAHLRDIYKRQYSASPMEYLQSIRLSKSKEFMENYSELSIKEIAEAVGFNDALYFSKVFRKEYNISPSRYRKEMNLYVDRQKG